MAAALSPSSHDDDSHTPTPTLPLPSASRRLPPPCWSPDETVALIDAYKDKWYSLRRGNLKATHWQEVADDVAARCPAGLPKTPVQCRHKMEKLRKRYRSEIQRAAAHGGVRRFTSSWVHFQSMYSMEKGPNPAPSSSDEDDEDDYNNNGIKRVNDLYSYNQRGVYGGQLNENNGAGSGFRIKIPGRATAGPTVAKVFPGIVLLGLGKLGRGLVKCLKRAKGQIEEMRMEMELKRTEMLLESEQRIVEAFAQAKAERSAKRAKRNSTTPD
ncbi:trihelix transcription factor ASIL1-like [Salvia divinorum]|uniref:Trihelix transcription factor ASIL1-like n=1 Tax=Salvia divinorum TaxID=28513 RepID=A0ABD1GQX1_SALDI